MSSSTSDHEIELTSAGTCSGCDFASELLDEDRPQSAPSLAAISLISMDLEPNNV